MLQRMWWSRHCFQPRQCVLQAQALTPVLSFSSSSTGLLFDIVFYQLLQKASPVGVDPKLIFIMESLSESATQPWHASHLFEPVFTRAPVMSDWLSSACQERKEKKRKLRVFYSKHRRKTHVIRSPFLPILIMLPYSSHMRRIGGRRRTTTTTIIIINNK